MIDDMVEMMLAERLEKTHRLMEQGHLRKRHYDRAIVSLLDGMLALLM